MNIQRFIANVRALRFKARRQRARTIQRHIASATLNASNRAQFARYKAHLRKLQSMQRGAPMRCEALYWKLLEEIQ